jgi:ABC-type enterochelin transport system ATPase subunit
MSDGSSIDVPTGGVLVFVGPNNAGKRFYLRDMFQLLTNEQTVSRMLYRLPL